VAGKRILFYSRGRPRYVSLDGKAADLGGCWSPGSSPGMIAREGWPTASLAGRVGTAEGAVGSSLPPGSAELINKHMGMICSVVFDIEGWTRLATLIISKAHTLDELASTSVKAILQ